MRSHYYLNLHAMTSGVTYPHIERVEGQPARLQRIPRVRVAQIVLA